MAVTTEDIKLLIESLREENKANNTALREENKAHYTLIRATIRSELDRIESKQDQVIKHQKWQNGKLEKHEKYCKRIEELERAPERKVVKALKKPRTWAALLIVLFATEILSVFLYNNIDWVKAFERKTGLPLIEHTEEFMPPNEDTAFPLTEPSEEIE